MTKFELLHNNFALEEYWPSTCGNLR